jgi:hypothetical protein
MDRGAIYVASRPASPDREAEYNTWYDEVHLQEVCALPGFVSARRFSPVRDDGPYLALYEIEGEDLVAIISGMFRVARQGGFAMSDAMQFEPPPEIRLLRSGVFHASR